MTRETSRGLDLVIKDFLGRNPSLHEILDFIEREARRVAVERSDYEKKVLSPWQGAGSKR